MSDKPGHPSNPLNVRLADVVYLNQRVQRDPDCEYCKRLLAEGTDFAPPHDASRRCESGKRSHCSCDTCF